jgi:hypothetical protein
MTVDELVRRLLVAVLAPTLGQHVLLVRLQHREPLDLPKVTGEAGSGPSRSIASSVVGRTSSSRARRLLGLFFLAVRLRLILDFFAFRFLAM